MRRTFWIGAALIFALLCGGCAAPPVGQPGAETAQTVPISAWPDNDLTSSLSEPAGSPAWAIDGLERGSFSLCYEDVSQSEFQTWLEDLQALGFAPAARAEEESENILLEGAEVSVSAACDPDGGTLVLRIARRPAE